MLTVWKSETWCKVLARWENDGSHIRHCDGRVTLQDDFDKFEMSFDKMTKTSFFQFDARNLCETRGRVIHVVVTGCALVAAVTRAINQFGRLLVLLLLN